MMKKIIATLILLLNISALLWGGYSYYSLSNSPIETAIYKIKETPEIANASLKIMKAYSDEEKIKRVNEIIGHYKELADHTNLTKVVTVSSINTMSQFINYFIVLSFVNVLLTGIFLYINRYNYF